MFLRTHSASVGSSDNQLNCGTSSLSTVQAFEEDCAAGSGCESRIAEGVEVHCIRTRVGGPLWVLCLLFVTAASVIAVQVEALVRLRNRTIGVVEGGVIESKYLRQMNNEQVSMSSRNNGRTARASCLTLLRSCHYGRNMIHTFRS